VQQGDVWGGTLFCSAIHPLLKKILSDPELADVLACLFSDNMQLFGRLSQILRAADLIRQAFGEVGLRFNPVDSKVFSRAFAFHPDQGEDLWQHIQASFLDTPLARE